MGNIGYSDPFALKEGAHLQFPYHTLPDWRAVKNLLVLQVSGQVDAVVLADVLHGLWRQQSRMGQHTHGIEDMAAGGEVAAEGTIGYAGEFCQLFLADEFVL